MHLQTTEQSWVVKAAHWYLTRLGESHLTF
jgi:hypothetical protein